MNLTQRSNGIWMLSYRENGKRIRVSTGERERPAAEAEARRILAGTSDRAAGAWTLEHALLDCYDRVWSKQKSADHTHRRLMKLVRLKGSTMLADVTYDWLVALTRELGEESGPATSNRYMALISKALGEAELRGKIERRPRVPYQREPEEKLRWLTREEEAQLMGAVAELWTEPDATLMRNLLAFLLDTGARLSEALKVGRTLSFTVGQVSQATFVDTKNGRSRSVPLTLRALTAAHKLPSWSVKACVERFSRLRDHCKLPDVTLHTMRHTCASRLVQGGMDLYRVQRWLGHSSITVTQRYAHLAPSSMDVGTAILECARREPIGEDPLPSVAQRAHLKLVK